MSKKKTAAEKALDEQIEFVDRTINGLYDQIDGLLSQIEALNNVRRNLVHTIAATKGEL